MNNYKELFEFAMQIEENGRHFYQQAMLSTSDTSLRLMFQYLAEEEANHFSRFEHLRVQADAYPPPLEDGLDSFSFLRAFVKNVVFSQDKLHERDALQSPLAIIRFALQRETESILYYEEIKRLFSQNVTPILDQIIGEEIQHYLKLSELTDKL